MTEENGEDKLVLLSCLEGWKSRVGETKLQGSEYLLFSFEALK